MRIFLFLVIFAVGCDSPRIEESPTMPSKLSLANEVRSTTLVQLKKERKLYPFGVGAAMMDQIKILDLGFRYYKEVNIDQARELLMFAGTLFLNTINAKEEIRPFLQNDPFQPKNIGIRIFLQKPNGSEPEAETLTVAAMVDGILDYDVRLAETGRLTTIYRETFQEAAAKLGIVEENGQYRRLSQLARDWGHFQSGTP